MKKLEKPIKPIEPDVRDNKKYPKEEGKQFADEKTPFIIDYKKYQKDTDKYLIDIQVWEQMKFIEDIKRASVESCFRKYKITKK